MSKVLLMKLAKVWVPYIFMWNLLFWVVFIINRLTPNDPYMGRTAPLTSERCILYIYSKNIGTEYFKHALHSPFFPLQTAVCFIMLTCLVPVLFTFYIQGVLKLKKNNSGAKGLIHISEAAFAQYNVAVSCYVAYALLLTSVYLLCLQQNNGWDLLNTAVVL